VQRDAHELVVAGAAERDAAELNRATSRAGYTLRSLSAVSDSLEDIFLELTGADDGELATARAALTGSRTGAGAGAA
jgi:hypothetical protein